MRNWFNCKVKYTKEVDGKLKKVTEQYLVDALSFTEAEARMHEQLEQMVRGEYTITNISKQNIADIFHYQDAVDWFKAKVKYITYDEESGKEKMTTHYMLVTANDVRDAYDRLLDSLKGMMVDFEIDTISKSSILDVFPYFSNEDVETETPSNLIPVAEYDQERDEVDEEIFNEEQMETDEDLQSNPSMSSRVAYPVLEKAESG